MIVNVIEPDNGRVLDPACGSGGMFVQSAHFIERMHLNPTERATFYGMEKNSTTIRLANMNLAVHGLEGNIHKAITYYEDPHELFGKCDFVMANPPFNVDEVDAEKVKNDPRLPYSLPGVNRKGKVPNGNYLWISYFDSYLNARGRAGFVMSSQASSAGGEEAKVRKRLIETSHVDVMMAVRPGFFYTRTVPCELWFLDKAKPEERRNKILMIDARNVHRKVTRKIYDFTPEQQKNLAAIVWLYRGQVDRFIALVAEHLERMIEASGRAVEPLSRFSAVLAKAIATLQTTDFRDDLAENVFEELRTAETTFGNNVHDFQEKAGDLSSSWKSWNRDNDALKTFSVKAEPLAETNRTLIQQMKHLCKLLSRIAEARQNRRGSLFKTLDEAQGEAVAHLKSSHYFWRQARWLQECFPDGKLRDVKGLVRLVDRKQLEENDWSLAPGRYVGVAPEEEDENFDFEEMIHAIHVKLEGLNEEAAELAATIARNFKELGV